MFLAEIALQKIWFIEKFSGRRIPEASERFLQFSSMSGTHCESESMGGRQWARPLTNTVQHLLNMNPGTLPPSNSTPTNTPPGNVNMHFPGDMGKNILTALFPRVPSWKLPRSPLEGGMDTGHIHAPSAAPFLGALSPLFGCYHKITEAERLGNNRNLFPTIPKSGTSKLKVPADVASG